MELVTEANKLIDSLFFILSVKGIHANSKPAKAKVDEELKIYQSDLYGSRSKEYLKSRLKQILQDLYKSYEQKLINIEIIETKVKETPLADRHDDLVYIFGDKEASKIILYDQEYHRIANNINRLENMLGAV